MPAHRSQIKMARLYETQSGSVINIYITLKTALTVWTSATHVQLLSVGIKCHHILLKHYSKSDTELIQEDKTHAMLTSAVHNQYTNSEANNSVQNLQQHLQK